MTSRLSRLACLFFGNFLLIAVLWSLAPALGALHVIWLVFMLELGLGLINAGLKDSD